MEIPAGVRATSSSSPDRPRRGTANRASVTPVACFGTTACSVATGLSRACYGQHRESNEFAGPGKTIARFTDSTVTPNAVSGGFNAHQDGNFQRNVYKIDVSKFWGRHELKGGVDWEDVDSEVNRYEGGAGQRISRLRSSAATGSQIYYRHRFFIDDTVRATIRTTRRPSSSPCR